MNILLYIPKIGDYLKILTVDKVKYFVIKNFGEYCDYAIEKLYSKLDEEKKLRKVVELLYIFSATPGELEKYVEMMESSSPDNCLCHYNIKILNRFDPELQLIHTKRIIKNKLK